MSLAATLAAGFAAGLVLGTLHFASLARNLALFAAGRTAAAFGLQLARLAATLAGFAVLARFGPVPVLAALAGLLAARGLALRRHGMRR